MARISSPRLLMLTHRLPYPPDRGDRIRSFNLMRQLAPHMHLSLASVSQEPVTSEQIQVLEQWTDQLAISPLRRWRARVRTGRAFLRGEALTPAYLYDPSLAKTIRDWHAREPFDAVLCFCSGMVKYARQLTGPRKILDLVDVDSAKWARYADQSVFPKCWLYRYESRCLRQIEAGLSDSFDAMTVVSERERQTYESQVGLNPRLHVVGNGVDLARFESLPDSDQFSILFVGVLDYLPNVQAVDWFAKEVMPRLRERLPQAVFQVVGRRPVQAVQKLDQLPGVEVVGSVDRIQPYMQRAGVVVAPLQIARGVQNKVLEAMASARVVVCSPQAAQGVWARDEQHFRIATEPDQWVHILEDILTHPAKRSRIARAAREHICRHYTWESQLQPMLALLQGYDISHVSGETSGGLSGGASGGASKPRSGGVRSGSGFSEGLSGGLPGGGPGGGPGVEERQAA